MILGDTCTRSCGYCNVVHGMPKPPDPREPVNVASAVHAMGLAHVVVTSVDRDDLPDFGASHFAQTIAETRARLPHCRIEVLIPDFKGDEAALRVVVAARPDILNHNLETVERLFPWARPGGRYWRSISFLGAAKRIDPAMLTKSGVILGLGETRDEIRQSLADLRRAAVDIVTLGQYLRPTAHHAPVARWVTPEEFADWKRIGEQELGFAHVEAGPLVRSSYHAEKQARTAAAGGVGEISEIVEVDLQAPAESQAGRPLVQIAGLRAAG
jgi:lipoic acid synthetase